MGKRFEGEEPTFKDMVAAYQMMGMTDLLGLPGDATAYASNFASRETVEFSILPGFFTAKEIGELREWAA